MNRLPFCRYVFWYHNERMVNYDVGRGITVFTSNAPDKTQSRFNIKEATPADSGNYTCNPSNAVPASIQVFVSKGRGEYSISLVACETLLMLYKARLKGGPRV